MQVRYRVSTLYKEEVIARSPRILSSNHTIQKLLMRENCSDSSTHAIESPKGKCKASINRSRFGQFTAA